MSQDNDPWGKNPKNTKGNDLEAILGKIKEMLFGNNQSGGSNNSGDANDERFSPNFTPKAIAGIGVVIFLGWLSTGLYIVEEGFNGVELRFGKHTETTSSGWRFHAPYPIGSVRKVDVGSVNSLTVGSKDNSSDGQMLTSDENIVEVGLSVQYKISNSENYLFQVNNPELVLRETFISSIREVIGGNNVDYILTDGRAEWPAKVRASLIKTLAGFNVGLDVLRVELKDAKAPAEVQDAFDDAVRAREDAERYKLQAEAYQNKEVPLARGNAKLITERAIAYKEAVAAKAAGEASRFTDILKSYQKAPEITRERMYFDSLQKVYSSVNNVLLDTGDNSPMLYMPMNQNMDATNGTNMPTPPVLPQKREKVDKVLEGSNFEYKTPVIYNKQPKTNTERKTR